MATMLRHTAPISEKTTNAFACLPFTIQINPLALAQDQVQVFGIYPSTDPDLDVASLLFTGNRDLCILAYRHKNDSLDTAPIRGTTAGRNDDAHTRNSHWDILFSRSRTRGGCEHRDCYRFIAIRRWGSTNNILGMYSTNKRVFLSPTEVLVISLIIPDLRTLPDYPVKTLILEGAVNFKWELKVVRLSFSTYGV
jgi:hypothetical protein